jgi:DnaK suppressor protein
MIRSGAAFRSGRIADFYRKAPAKICAGFRFLLLKAAFLPNWMRETAMAAKKQTSKAVEPENVTPYEPEKGEAYMSEAQQEHFRMLLRTWKKNLMEEVDRTVGHMKDDATNFPDPNDRATQEEEFSLELRTRDRERKLLKKIDEALDMIEANEYGYCESCGIEIGIRRLEVRPTATLCIDCKTLEEIREKQKV